MVNNFDQFDSQTQIKFQKNKPIKNSSFRIYILLLSFILAFFGDRNTNDFDGT